MSDIDRMKQLAGISKLDEIEMVQPLQDSGIDQYNPLDGEEVFRVDGYPVYLNTIGKQDIYTAMDGGNVVSTSVFNKEHMPQYGEVYLAMRGYTEPNYRGKGISMKMTLDIKRLTSKVLISDVRLTNDGYNTWMKLKKLFNVKIIRISTGEVMPIAGNEHKLQDQQDQHTFIIETDILSRFRIVESESICTSFEYIQINSDEDLLDM